MLAMALPLNAREARRRLYRDQAMFIPHPAIARERVEAFNANEPAHATGLNPERSFDIQPRQGYPIGCLACHV